MRCLLCFYLDSAAKGKTVVLFCLGVSSDLNPFRALLDVCRTGQEVSRPLFMTVHHISSTWHSSTTNLLPNLTQLELSSESNLFFYYAHDIDETSFKELQVGGSSVGCWGTGQMRVTVCKFTAKTWFVGHGIIQFWACVPQHSFADTGVERATCLAVTYSAAGFVLGIEGARMDVSTFGCWLLVPSTSTMLENVRGQLSISWCTEVHTNSFFALRCICFA